MQKYMIRRRTYRYLLLCLSLLGLSGLCNAGCGKRNVNYIEGGTEKAGESGTAAGETDAKPDIWEDYYTAKPESGNTVSISIKAAVGDAPDTSEVMGIKRTVLEESTKKQIAETVLGDEVSFEDGVYTGSRDGISYQMRMGERRISFYPADAVQIAPEEIKAAETCGLSAESRSGNRCELSAEEAVGLAEQFLEEIGFSDRIFCNMKQLVWMGGMRQQSDEDTSKTISVTDGYVIYFEQTLNGEQVPQFSDGTEQEAFELWQDGREYASSSGMKMHTVLCVDDHGVIAMDMYNFYEITLIEENVSLLPVSTVQDIIQNELTEHADKYINPSEDDLFYKNMSFGYCLIWDEAGESGSYVPAWQISDGNWEFSKIVVNAIDGSVIPQEQRNLQ